MDTFFLIYRKPLKTDGFNLRTHINLLKKATIREIQITLDGNAQTHNLQRFLKDHSITFDQISEIIDVLLSNRIPLGLQTG